VFKNYLLIILSPLPKRPSTFCLSSYLFLILKISTRDILREQILRAPQEVVVSSNLTGYTKKTKTRNSNYVFRGRMWCMKELLSDPIFSETKRKLDELGIEAVLFDLDDTLIYTSEMFIHYMEVYSALVAERIDVRPEEIMKALQGINDEEYKKMGVNPKRWEAVVEKLALQFGHGEKEILGNLDVLMKIYTMGPRLRKGVRGMLDVFRQSGVKMVLVTHANVQWTEFKLDFLSLWDDFDAVIIVDENGHKKSIDWKKGMDAVETEPKNCLVVGDSLGGDIRPGAELGARTIYLPSPWSVYREGDVPEGTEIIDEIFETLAALSRLR